MAVVKNTGLLRVGDRVQATNEARKMQILKDMGLCETFIVKDLYFKYSTHKSEDFCDIEDYGDEIHVTAMSHIKELLDTGKYMHLADLVSTVDKNKKVTCCIYWLDRVL